MKFMDLNFKQWLNFVWDEIQEKVSSQRNYTEWYNKWASYRYGNAVSCIDYSAMLI